MRYVGAVVLEEELKYAELPVPPRRSDEVTAKVLGAALTPVDVAVIRGLLPHSYGKIVGSAGLVRVLELGAEVRGFSVGESALVAPRCFIELAMLGNGLMAEQVSVKSKCLEPVPQSISGLEGVYASLLAHLPQVVMKLSGSSLLLAGCSYEARVLAGLAKDQIKTEAMCASREGLRRMARLGVKAYLSEPDEASYDVVYLASLDPLVSWVAVRKCAESLIVSPLVPEYLVPLGANVRRIHVMSKDKVDTVRALSLARGFGQELGETFRVVSDLRAAVEVSPYHSYVVYVPQ